GLIGESQVSRLTELGQVTCLAECARYQRFYADLAGVAVDLDPKPEGVDDGAALLGVGVGQGLAQIGQGGADRARGLGVDGRAVAARVLTLGEHRAGLLSLGLEVADSLADEDRINSRLDRGELALDP